MLVAGAFSFRPNDNKTLLLTIRGPGFTLGARTSFAGDMSANGRFVVSRDRDIAT